MGARASKIAVIISSIGLGMSLTACSDNVEDASAEYCDSLGALRLEIDDLAALVNTNASLEEIQEQADAVREAYEDAAGNTEDLEAALAQESDAAYEDYQDQVGDIPGEATLDEALPLYRDAVEGYLTDLSAIADSAGCDIAAT